MYKLLRPLLFSFPPETIHDIIVCALKSTRYLPGHSFLFRKLFGFKHIELKREVFGLTFENPIGFAAGFDKNAVMYNELGDLGFAFIEIGTVTPLAQPGNPRPRSFRLPKDCALINRMGFNNDGLNVVLKRLRHNRKRKIIVGGNIGKNTATPNENAVDDYLKTFKGLYDYVDYFTVNISCPNVCNLQKLQDKHELELIIRALIAERRYRDNYKPILLKISPDLSFDQIDDVLYIIRETGIDGVVATNTTTSREELSTSPDKVRFAGKGGLSGKPLTKRSLEIVRHISEQTSGQLPIIGTGGIMTVKDVLAMLDAGASLVQLYTGYIYQGPGFLRRILKAIVKH